MYNPGFEIIPQYNPLGFKYGNDVFGPDVENRTLNQIRQSLKDPNCSGPDIVYSIAMDVGKNKHRDLLNEMHLLYGVVMYAAGKLGDEPIRSQGHIHKFSEYEASSTPEVYEIWTGEAIIYMQEFANENPGRCFAVRALPGEVVIVPPNWVHATISANSNEPLVFGAWCDRNYGFEYDELRLLGGIAWFPVYDAQNNITWEANNRYQNSSLVEKSPNDYTDLGIKKHKSIYTIFEEAPDTFLYVPKPKLKEHVWQTFEP